MFIKTKAMKKYQNDTSFDGHSVHKMPTVRGGVEDTRLEAKDTKKIRGQDQGQPFRGQTFSRPRTGMLEAKDRNARGQGPRTQAQVLPKKKKKKVFTKIFQAISKKKKRSSQKFFKRSPRKNVFQKIFQALHKILTIQKILLSSSRGQANFRGLEASRPRTSSRTPPLPTVTTFTQLKDLIGRKSWVLFKLTNKQPLFLSKPASLWERNECYIRIKSRLQHLRVVYDFSERALGLVTDYHSSTITRSPSQKQFLYQVVKNL